MESRVEEFIKNRKSILNEKELQLAKSMVQPALALKGDPQSKMPDTFKIHEKEDDYFNRMGELEQERLYTSLHDQNQRLKKHIKELKKEFITFMNTYGDIVGLDMKTLEEQNKELREDLKDLTFKKEKAMSTKADPAKAKKQLLKAYGPNDSAHQGPGAVVFVG